MKYHKEFTEWLDNLNNLYGLQKTILGKVNNHPIYLLKGTNSTADINLLIAAGFHGDEPAGPLAVKNYIEKYYAQKPSNINISILPLVNPTGLLNNIRENYLKQDPNRGYCHPELNNKISVEGSILLENKTELIKLSQNGLLTLHEDIDLEEHYIYSNQEHPTKAASAILEALGQYSPAYKNIELYGDTVVNAYIKDIHDGSFEDLLAHSGHMNYYCTETPGLADLEERVKANTDVIRAFIRNPN